MQDDLVLSDPLRTGPHRLEIISTLFQRSGTAPGTFVEVVLATGDDNRAMSVIAYSITNSSFFICSLFGEMLWHCIDYTVVSFITEIYDCMNQRDLIA